MEKVIIYSSPTCVYCTKAKDFLKKHNVEYTDYDVVADEAKREEMIEKSGQMGTPVIYIGEEMIVGFDEAKISELLGIK